MTGKAHLATMRSSGPISVIIPAYNEAERVGQVLSAVTRLPYWTQIIVVDDASDDHTTAVVRDWQRRHTGIELIDLQENHGKTGAIARASPHVRGEIVIFLDADLMGLTPAHVRQLVEPVRQGHCAMTVGLFHNGRPSTDLPHHVLPFLSGQRCLRWPLFQGINLLPDSGWSLETALNLHRWFHRYATRRVTLEGVSHAMRPEKQPGLRGYLSHVAMWWHIGRYTFQFVRDKGLRSIIKRLLDTQPTVARLPAGRQRRRRSDAHPAGRPFL